MAWHVSGLWQTLVTDQDQAGGLAALFVKPLPLSMEYSMLHWQLLALLSLILHGLWAGRRILAGMASPLDLPLLCHLGWLATATALHVVGLLSDFIVVQYILD